LLYIAFAPTLNANAQKATSASVALGVS